VLLAPFVVGGLAAGWLAITSTSAILVAIGWASSVLAAGAIVLLLTAAPAERRQRGRLATPDRRGERWPARPVWSSAVRGVTVFAPVGVSVSVALAVQEILPPPGGGWMTVGHVLLLLVCGLGVLYPAEQATRRLAPITMLLKLSLAFPSAAPSRFRVARRSGNVGTLRKALEARHVPDDPARTEVAGTLLALVAALTAHDSRTRGHSERVRVFTEMLAAELGVDDHSRERLRWSALLHDIGKMAVSAEVLNKPAQLDEEEWVAVRRHPAVGAQLVAPLSSWLGEWGAAVMEHHERLDGSGYPHGLEKDEISLGARIIAVADAFDTMVTPRPYRGAMSPGAAREEVARFSASQFDPRVVRALMSLSIPRLWWRIGLAAWLAHLPLLRKGGPGRSQRAAARSPVPIAGMLSLLAAVVVLTASGLVGTEPSIPGGAGNDAGMPSELDSSASGTITVGSPSGPSIEPGGVEPAQDTGPGTEVLSEEAEAEPADGPSEAAGGGGEPGPKGQEGGGAGGGQGGSGGDEGAVGGEGVVVEANEDVIVTGTPGDEADQPVGGTGVPPVGTPPPQTPPPSPQPTPAPPPQSEDCAGHPGQNGNGHAYGHCKHEEKHNNKG
jgi:putative nucleotidyltransferase with HDIG domain